MNKYNHILTGTWYFCCLFNPIYTLFFLRSHSFVVCAVTLSYLSRSLADRWGTTVDFTISFLRCAVNPPVNPQPRVGWALNTTNKPTATKSFADAVKNKQHYSEHVVGTITAAFKEQTSTPPPPFTTTPPPLHPLCIHLALCQWQENLNMHLNRKENRYKTNKLVVHACLFVLVRACVLAWECECARVHAHHTLLLFLFKWIVVASTKYISILAANNESGGDGGRGVIFQHGTRGETIGDRLFQQRHNMNQCMPMSSPQTLGN